MRPALCQPQITMLLGRVGRPCLRSGRLNGIMSAEPASAHGISSKPAPSPGAAIDFLMLLQKLKVFHICKDSTTKRTGWVRMGVHEPESIADHMYRMGMMSLIATDSGVDVQRCIRMALVHDVAEAIVGDITPHCQVSPEEKRRLEADAINTIQHMLGQETQAASDVSSLWGEYEQGVSPEAKLVKDFDKLEMIIQAHEYEQAQPGKQLQEFFDSTDGKWRTETGRAWAAELVARRAHARGKTDPGTSSTGPVPP